VVDKEVLDPFLRPKVYELWRGHMDYNLMEHGRITKVYEIHAVMSDFERDKTPVKDKCSDRPHPLPKNKLKGFAQNTSDFKVQYAS